MAEFTVSWLNRLDQFGRTDFTLLITDNSGIIPPTRIEKSFTNMPLPNQEVSFLEDVATDEIERLVLNWNELQSLPDPLPEELGILYGSGVPDSGIGFEGQYYLDIYTGDLLMKQSGVW